MHSLPDTNSIRITRLARLVALAALALSACTLLIPAPADIASGPFHSLFFITTLIVTEYCGAAVLFTLGLRGFTEGLKRAYGLFIGGFLLLAVGYIQLPLMPLFHLADTWWALYGFIAIPFFGGIGCVYAGVRGFAKLFKVRRAFTSVWLMAGVAVVGSVLCAFLPNGAPNIPMTDAVLQVSKFSQAITTIVAISVTVLGYQTRRRAGSAYIPAFAWLYVYLLLDAVSGVGGFIVRLGQPGHNSASDSGVIYILFVVSSFALLKAAVEFNKIRYGRDITLPPDEQTFFGKPLGKSTAKDTVADVITYLAGFASDATAIDPILDNMRVMTSTRDPGPFTESEQRRLARIYLQLEQYLAESDPVRRYSRDELRGILHGRFALVMESNKAFADTIGA